MIAFFQTWGQSARWNDELNMSSRLERAFGPRSFRNEAGMSPGPAAPFAFILLIARLSSRMLNFGGGAGVVEDVA